MTALSAAFRYGVERASSSGTSSATSTATTGPEPRDSPSRDTPRSTSSGAYSPRWATPGPSPRRVPTPVSDLRDARAPMARRRPHRENAHRPRPATARLASGYRPRRPRASPRYAPSPRSSSSSAPTAARRRRVASRSSIVTRSCSRPPPASRRITGTRSAPFTRRRGEAERRRAAARRPTRPPALVRRAALEAGLALPEVSELARHANPRITAMAYAGLTDEARAKLGDKHAAAFEAQA